MFLYPNKQKTCLIGDIKIGGQPGENPPLLVANMFQKGDKLLESRKEAKFDHNAAEIRIKELEKRAQKFAEETSWNNVAKQHIELYEEVIAKRKEKMTS